MRTQGEPAELNTDSNLSLGSNQRHLSCEVVLLSTAPTWHSFGFYIISVVIFFLVCSFFSRVALVLVMIDSQQLVGC